MANSVKPSEETMEKNGDLTPPPKYDDVAFDKEKVLMEEQSEPSEVDPWDMPHIHIPTTPWRELSTGGKIKRVVTVIVKLITLLGLLYTFICSLDILSSAFRLLAGKAAGEVFTANSVLSNPVAGLMIGVLVTVLVQSSSTSTSIIVTMVGTPGLLSVEQAIPMVMGANIGTTVTNTIVALPQSTNRNEFRRAFAGATVHDMFNWLCVFILLPLELATHYLYHLSDAITSNINSTSGSDQDFLKVITKPFTSLIVQLDKSVIKDVALGQADEDAKILKTWCEYIEVNKTEYNFTDGTWWNYTYIDEEPYKRCKALFSLFDMSDAVAGMICLALALLMLCSCLILIVKLLNSMLKGQIALIIKKTLNADFPGKLSFLTGYVAIAVGVGMTILVQSSSIFTSALTPLVGIGLISVERMFPLTLGSNIGTTVTGLLASLAASGDGFHDAIQIALCHLFFNISGIVIWYPIPKIRAFPIFLAKQLGNTTADYRWFAIAYLIFMYFVFPASIFGLSLAGLVAFLCVLIPILLIAIFVVIVNVLQSKKPEWLPKVLQTWDFLPEPLRSLAPYDRVIMKVTGVCTCCKCCQSNKFEDEEESIDKKDVENASNVETVDEEMKDQAHDNAAFDNTYL